MLYSRCEKFISHYSNFHLKIGMHNLWFLNTAVPTVTITLWGQSHTPLIRQQMCVEIFPLNSLLVRSSASIYISSQFTCRWCENTSILFLITIIWILQIPNYRCVYLSRITLCLATKKKKKKAKFWAIWNNNKGGKNWVIMVMVYSMCDHYIHIAFFPWLRPSLPSVKLKEALKRGEVVDLNQPNRWPVIYVFVVSFSLLTCLIVCSECTRGGFCNFMHLKPISRDLKWVTQTPHIVVVCFNWSWLAIGLYAFKGW